MNSTALLFILFVHIVLRLAALKRTKLRVRPLLVSVRLVVALVPLLFFEPGLFFIWYCGFVIVSEAAFWAIEMLVPDDGVALARALYFAGYLAGTFGLTAFVARPEFGLLGPLVMLPSVQPASLLVAIGFAYQIKEANQIVVYFIGRYGIAPKEKRKRAHASIDEVEIRRGNIIGVLERLLIFLFVITGNYPVIGLVLAAKGFARYRNLDDKDFAEYVLIGTLLSYFMAIGTGALCRYLIDSGIV